MNLQLVDVSCGRFSVAEDKDNRYKMHLVECESEDRLSIIHLWQVEIVRRDEDQVVYVLASTEDGAISQATCGMASERNLILNTIARIVPLKIRGWGKTEF